MNIIAVREGDLFRPAEQRGGIIEYGIPGVNPNKRFKLASSAVNYAMDCILREARRERLVYRLMVSFFALAIFIPLFLVLHHDVTAVTVLASVLIALALLIDHFIGVILFPSLRKK